MRPYRPALVLLLLVAPAIAPASTTRPTTAPAAEVERLIAQLGADEWGLRQEAVDQLTALGDAVTDRIQRLAREARDEEVRARAESILKLLADHRLVGPTLVTLHLKAATADAALAELSRQSGIRVQPQNEDVWRAAERPAVTLDLDRVPFCVALRDLCTILHAAPAAVEPGRLLLHPDEDAALDGPFVAHGPFLVVAQQIDFSKTVRLAGKRPQERDISIQFGILVEPKLRVLSLPGTIKVEATDDKGNALANADVPDEGDMIELSGAPTDPVALVTAPLTYPDNPGKRITSLRGTAKFVVQIRAETLDFPDVLKARDATRSVAGTKFTLRRCRKVAGNEYEALLVAHRGAVDDAGWRQLAALVQAGGCRLLDAKGRPLFARGVTDVESEDTQFQATLRFAREDPENVQRIGEPARFVLDIPVETRELSCPFEFKDLPMP